MTDYHVTLNSTSTLSNGSAGPSWTTSFTLPGIAPAKGLAQETFRAIEAEDSKLSLDGGTMAGAINMNGNGLNAGNGVAMVFQDDGNIVAYSAGQGQATGRVPLLAVGDTTGKDEGGYPSVVASVPMLVPNPVQGLPASDEPMQAINQGTLAQQGFVQGNQHLDDMSLKMVAIKSQFVDSAKTKPAGIEYIDEAGNFNLAISGQWADDHYVTKYQGLQVQGLNNAIMQIFDRSVKNGDYVTFPQAFNNAASVTAQALNPPGDAPVAFAAKDLTSKGFTALVISTPAGGANAVPTDGVWLNFTAYGT
ncbi:hypothetical protein E3E12_08190 [Formicincola oecophyllae]|uniref:Uncharacterized protein n=1 Tax=Formicincola oecophyllae TaxID=2558361 RepID=A0A4Y6UDS4_9PROT|nr:hypothetical protein [Formicincola oecophyllae]QDH14175.1 hypothetical protein E3E12_08190 [Formicincola oecophyllae]